MIDISFWEILVIIIVALVIIKPENVPKVACNIGRWFRYLKNLSTSLTTAVNKQIQIEAERESQEKQQSMEADGKEQRHD